MDFSLTLCPRKNNSQGYYLVVLIHGLGDPGAFDSQNRNWKELLLNDETLPGVDVGIVRYNTAHISLPGFGFSASFVLPIIRKTICFGPVNGLKVLTKHLIREMEGSELQRYKKIIFVCHSQGGLIAMRYYFEMVKQVAKQNKWIKIVRYISIATPFKGTVLATLAKLVQKNEQVYDLASGSQFLEELKALWEKYADSPELILDRFVFTYADEDQWVENSSAVPSFAMEDDWEATLLSGSHSTVLKLGQGKQSQAYKFVRDKIHETLFSRDRARYFPNENMGLQPDPWTNQIEFDANQGVLYPLRFYSRASAFIGRDKEMQQLKAFCNDQKKFSWWVVAGDFGMGKSRLTFEHILAMKRDEGWNGFFLGDGDILEKNLSHIIQGTITPIEPTLLVIDNASFYENSLAKVLGKCAERSGKWEEKVRILILNRSIKGGWYERLTENKNGQVADLIYNSRFQDPLQLTELAEPDFNRIFESFGSKSMEKIALWERFQVDRRPLHAILINYCQEPYANGNIDDIIRNAYLQIEKIRWEAASFTRQDEMLLRFATVCDSIDLDFSPLPTFLAEQLEQVQYVEDNDGFWRRWAGVTREDSRRIHGIKPHLVGDLFVLDSLNFPLNKYQYDYIISQIKAEFQAYWNYSPKEFLFFSMRILQEYPNHKNTLPWIRVVIVTCPGEEAHKLLMVDFLSKASYLLGEMGRKEESRELYQDIVKLAGTYEHNADIAVAQATAAHNLIGDNGQEELAANRELYRDIVRLAGEYEHNADIAVVQAKAGMHLIGQNGQKELAASRELYQDIVKLTGTYEHNADIAVAQARAANILIYHNGQEELAASRELYQDIVRLAGTYDHNADIAVMQAKAAHNLIGDNGQEELAASRELYQDIVTLAGEYEHNADIAVEQATAANNLIYHNGQEELAASRVLYQDIVRLAGEYERNADIAVVQAKAAHNLIGDTGKEELVASWELYQDIVRLAGTYEHNADIAMVQATAASNLILYTGKEELAASRVLYQDIVTLAGEYEHNADIAMVQAKAANILIYHNGQEELAASRELYQDIVTLAEEYEHNADFAVAQATAAYNLILTYVDLDERAIAQQLHAELYFMSKKFPNNKVIADIYTDLQRLLYQ